MVGFWMGGGSDHQLSLNCDDFLEGRMIPEMIPVPALKLDHRILLFPDLL